MANDLFINGQAIKFIPEIDLAGAANTVGCIGQVVDEGCFTATIIPKNAPKRVVWLAEHAKKERTRKKNRNRIRKTFLRLMKQMGGGSE